MIQPTFTPSEIVAIQTNFVKAGLSATEISIILLIAYDVEESSTGISIRIGMDVNTVSTYI